MNNKGYFMEEEIINLEKKNNNNNIKDNCKNGMIQKIKSKIF